MVEEEEVKGFVDVRLHDGAEEVVAWLRHERGMQVALATRNNPKCVDMLVERCAFASVEDEAPTSFTPVLTRVFKSAVDVDKLLGVCHEWDLPPASVLVVGDSLGTVLFWVVGWLGEVHVPAFSHPIIAQDTHTHISGKAKGLSTPCIILPRL